MTSLSLIDSVIERFIARSPVGKDLITCCITCCKRQLCSADQRNECITQVSRGIITSIEVARSWDYADLIPQNLSLTHASAAPCSCWICVRHQLSNAGGRRSWGCPQYVRAGPWKCSIFFCQWRAAFSDAFYSPRAQRALVSEWFAFYESRMHVCRSFATKKSLADAETNCSAGPQLYCRVSQTWDRSIIQSKAPAVKSLRLEVDSFPRGNGL